MNIGYAAAAAVDTAGWIDTDGCSREQSWTVAGGGQSWALRMGPLCMRVELRLRGMLGLVGGRACALPSPFGRRNAEYRPSLHGFYGEDDRQVMAGS